MTRLVINSIVGADGVLHLTVPVGPDEANNEVRVTVESVPAKKPMTQEEWRAFVYATAGSIDDPTFQRPPQGFAEERDPLE